jgi:release factor glutamine methyltransferase
MTDAAGGPDSVAALLVRAARRLADAGIPAAEAPTEARLLMQHALAVAPEQLRLRHPDRSVGDDEVRRYDALVERRRGREPLAYITGSREFYGLALRVTPAVLIPRPETEFVVEAVLRHVAPLPAPRVADVGTGSGCIAVAVAVHARRAAVFASDIAPDAIALARENAAAHGVGARVVFAAGDLLRPLEAFGPFDAVASNPPYVAPGEIEQLEPEVRDWEPRRALGVHDDPLHFYRRLAREAPPLLAPGGALIVEVGAGQAATVAELWRETAGLREVRVTPDYAAVPRVVSGIRRLL